MKVQETTIRRMRKYEAEQAIKDLQKRSYEIVSPLMEKKREGKRFGAQEYKRVAFIEHTMSSVWMAKLRRVVE